MTQLLQIPAKVAFQQERNNTYSTWCSSPASTIASTEPDDAATRIHDAMAQIHPQGPALGLTRESRVFTMGSCFAREIEGALVARGGRVISMDQSYRIPAFHDGTERGYRLGFFHRFTPRAMLQEFQRCFDEIAWDDDTLLFETTPGGWTDFHYHWTKGLPNSREAAAERRAVARALVRRVIDADVVILTLGLIESWVHLPTGLHLNRFAPGLVRQRPEELAFTQIDYADTLHCLEEIHALLRRHHATGNFHMVVTVSPVPLQVTFSGQDIVIANAESKATLRAATAAFCRSGKATYFPSYEILTHSDPKLAFRCDRVHVEPGMVRHIVDTFVRTHYAPGAL